MSTIKVNAIEPYSGGTVDITGYTPTTASYAENANALTPGDKVLSGSISFEPAKGINLQENSFAGGTQPSYLRFYSGSSQGANYINMQNEPNGNGRVTISAFPANDHFFFLDPNTHTTEFDGKISGYSGTPLTVTGDLNVSSSVGNTKVTDSGRSVQMDASDVENSYSLFAQNPNFFNGEYHGIVSNWYQFGGTANHVVAEANSAAYTVNAFPDDFSYDHTVKIKADSTGISFNDWLLPSYGDQPWLKIPQDGAPAFQRDTEVTGSLSVTEALKLTPQDPLPSGTVGDLAVSGSSLYFYNGAWTLVV